MNKMLWIVAAAAGYLTYKLLTAPRLAASRSTGAQPVDALAQRLQAAWVDHRTVA